MLKIAQFRVWEEGLVSAAMPLGVEIARHAGEGLRRDRRKFDGMRGASPDWRQRRAREVDRVFREVAAGSAGGMAPLQVRPCFHLMNSHEFIVENVLCILFQAGKSTHPCTRPKTGGPWPGVICPTGAQQ
ncbi:MAG: hypothetical protein ACLR23_28335 [Clostridia bacterium]